jgi:hypothetical protein
MPNPLVAGPMLTAGPIDVYGKFVSGVTEEEDTPGFHPYTLGSDFFIFSYDWRQEIATVTAPQLGTALEKYAAFTRKNRRSGRQETEFILVATAWAVWSRALF